MIRSIASALGLSAILALALVAAYLMGDTNGTSGERSKWEAANAQAAAWAAQSAAETQHERFRQREIVDENHRKEVDRLRGHADAARSELARLRVALADRSVAADHASAAGRPDGAAAERELLGACSTAFQDMAEEADRIAERLMGLQRYVAGVVAPDGGR